MWLSCTAALLPLIALAPATVPATEPAPAAATTPVAAAYVRTRDVIYGRVHGTALTMDVLQPKRGRNGAAVIWVISGAWRSRPEAITDGSIERWAGELLRRGYTVFAVVHRSTPRFTIPEAAEDVNRAARFIRHYAKDYGIDPNRIGAFGGSAAGHLALLVGCSPEAEDAGSDDPVDRVSGRVRAVACLFPPTDFLNYGRAGEVNLGSGVLAPYRHAFDFVRLDQDTKRMLLVSDEARRQEIGRAISPIYHVDAGDPPVLLIHGDADTLVPIQQAEGMVGVLRKAGVAAELIPRPGRGHEPNFAEDIPPVADWFDRHLAK